MTTRAQTTEQRERLLALQHAVSALRVLDVDPDDILDAVDAGLAQDAARRTNLAAVNGDNELADAARFLSDADRWAA